MTTTRSNSNTLAKGFALSLAALALASTAQAALLSYESFSGYTDATQLDAQTAPAVAGYTGNWVHASTSFGTQDILSSSTGLTYSGLATTGGSAGVPTSITPGPIDSTNSGRVARQLDSTISATASTDATYYMSFLFQSGQETGVSTYQTLALYDGIGNTDSDAARNFDIGLTDNGALNGDAYGFGADNNTYYSTNVAATTDVRLFVVKFTLSSTDLSDSVQVWVDPTSEGDTSISVSSLNLTWDTITLSDYEGNSANWDEIRWGTTFGDVTPIPEPSAFAALAGLAGLAAVGLRRRRRTAA